KHCSKFTCYLHQHIHGFSNSINPFTSFPETRDRSFELISTYAMNQEPSVEEHMLACSHGIYFAKKLKDEEMEKAFSDREKMDITSLHGRSFIFNIGFALHDDRAIIPSLLDIRALLAKSILSESEYIGIDKQTAMSKLGVSVGTISLPVVGSIFVLK